MNPHIKSLCILGTVIALGFWNCDDSNTVAANNEQNSQETALAEATAVPATDSTPVNNGENGNIEVIYNETIQVTADSTNAATNINPANDATAISASENDSSKTVAESSSQMTAVESSSSVATQTVSSSSTLKPEDSSSSQTIVPESSSTPASSSTQDIPTTQTVKKSIGCGKSLNGIKTGFAQINVNGKNRDYAIDIPTNYDPNKPYRLFYTSHWFGGSAKDVVNGTVSNGGADNWAFFGLKRMAKEANEPAIFIAPSMNGATWDLAGNGADHALFSNLLNYAKTNLCIDEERVFATGFSFGAMMSYSLSLTHQDEIRAVATLAAANFVGNANSPWVPYPADSKKKIAYLGITGMSDGTCPFIGNKDKKMGGLYAALLHAQDNDCEIPAVPENIDHTNPGSKSHVTYDFKNCAEGYPVRYITFDGGHIAAPTDGQTSDDGKRTWAPKAMWDFFTQF